MSAASPPPYPTGPGTPEDPGTQGTAGTPVPVPEELAVAPPGAVLAGMLEDIEIERVSGHDTVEVMCAEYRQLCRQQARFYRAVLETGLRKPFSISTVRRVSVPGEFAAEEAPNRHLRPQRSISVLVLPIPRTQTDKISMGRSPHHCLPFPQWPVTGSAGADR